LQEIRSFRKTEKERKMEVVIFIILGLIILLAICAVGVVVEVIWKIIDFDHKMFSGDFWKFEWLSNFFQTSENSHSFNEAKFDREWEEKQRADKAYDSYKSYRSMQMDDDTIDDRMRWDGYSKDERDNAKYEYNKGCYIATASLQGDIPYDDLLPLKQWRYEVMEKSEFGNKLSNHYRRTAPELAKKVDQMPVLASFLREWFIRPFLTMVNKERTFFRNVLLYINFFFVLGLTTIFTKFKKF
jgi:hypothetical protein